MVEKQNLILNLTAKKPGVHPGFFALAAKVFVPYLMDFLLPVSGSLQLVAKKDDELCPIPVFYLLLFCGRSRQFREWFKQKNRWDYVTGINI